jgi:hypothetical protein
MTPQEIFEYKNKWMSQNPHSVKIHSDLEDKGKQWCKNMLEPQEWKFQKWSDIYEHTFYFENIHAAQNFEMEFSRYVNK